MYDYTYYGTDFAMLEPEASSALAIAGGAASFAYIVSMAVCILMIVSYWKLFKKAGQPGWAAIVPVYNFVVMFKVAKMNPWLILLFLVPIVNFVAIIVLDIMLCINTAKAFGKDAGYGVGLLFLPVIFYPMLALGNAEYEG